MANDVPEKYRRQTLIRKGFMPGDAEKVEAFARKLAGDSTSWCDTDEGGEDIITPMPTHCGVRTTCRPLRSSGTGLDSWNAPAVTLATGGDNERT